MSGESIQYVASCISRAADPVKEASKIIGAAIGAVEHITNKASAHQLISAFAASADANMVEKNDGGPIMAAAPFRYDPRMQRVLGTRGKLGGDVMVCDVRAWGYLTGGGHGALGMDAAAAAKVQDEFGETIARLLNEHAEAMRQSNG